MSWSLIVLDNTITFIRQKMVDPSVKLSCTIKGIVSITQFDKAKKIGYLGSDGNSLVYYQLETPNHILKGWNAWTIDKAIFDRLPHDAIIRYFCGKDLYEYSVLDIINLRIKTEANDINMGEYCYEEKNFKGYSTRIILPIDSAHFVHNFINDKKLYGEYKCLMNNWK